MQNILKIIKNHPYYAISAAILIVIVVLVAIRTEEQATQTETGSTRSVATLQVADYSKGALGIAVPVAGDGSFVVRAESSGRIDEVVADGKKVTKGTVIAKLGNDSQQAALVQAQGTYEAAVAGAAQSDVSVKDASSALTAAKQSAVSANRTALSDWNNVLYNTVDELFTNPRSSVPGVRIDTQGKANELNDARVSFTTTLKNWQDDTTSLSEADGTARILTILNADIDRTQQLLSVVDTFITLLPKTQNNGLYTDSEIAALQVEFATARTTLNGDLSSLAAAKTTLQRAEEALRKAEIGGTGSDVSTANASVKQALGAYQSAKAAYDKTFIKAPFDGTLTAVNVEVGDIINYGTDIAIIIPDANADTTKTFDLPITAIKYTPENAYVFTVDSDNVLNAVPVETGLVTANYINVTGLTGDEVIVVDVRGLKDGTHVTVNN